MRQLDREDAAVRDSVEVPQRIGATPVELAVHASRDRAEMVIGLECDFDGRLDEQTLVRAGELLVDAEPMLGFRLVPDGGPPHWERVRASEQRVVTIVRGRDEYEAIRRSGLHATEGEQVAVCLWPREAGDRLLVRITHVVGDGFALQLVASRLSSLYSALEADPGYRPSPGRLPVRDPSELFASIPKLARLRAVLGFAWFMAPRLLPRRTHRLPLPDEPVGPWVPVVRCLPAPALVSLARYGKERGATLNDVFLAAAYRALAATAWDGTSALRIVITVDLRRWCLPPRYAGTISNLSSWEFPFLMRNPGRSFDETLDRVSAMMCRRKRSRPGLALALIAHRTVRKLPQQIRADDGTRDLSTTPEGGFTVTLSNEGLLDGSRLRFAGQAPISAFILPPFPRPPWLHLCLSGYNGALTLATVTSRNGVEPAARFLDALLAELPADAVA